MVEITPPTERSCERCGRKDVWDEEQGKWTIQVEDGERLVGDRHCIHEWDINGHYSPITNTEA
jgi:hypothetical protein